MPQLQHQQQQQPVLAVGSPQLLTTAETAPTLRYVLAAHDAMLARQAASVLAGIPRPLAVPLTAGATGGFAFSPQALQLQRWQRWRQQQAQLTRQQLTQQAHVRQIQQIMQQLRAMQVHYLAPASISGGSTSTSSSNNNNNNNDDGGAADDDATPVAFFRGSPVAGPGSNSVAVGVVTQTGGDGDTVKQKVRRASATLHRVLRDLKRDGDRHATPLAASGTRPRMVDADEDITDNGDEDEDGDDDDDDDDDDDNDDGGSKINSGARGSLRVRLPSFRARVT